MKRVLLIGMVILIAISFFSKAYAEDDLIGEIQSLIDFIDSIGDDMNFQRNVSYNRPLITTDKNHIEAIIHKAAKKYSVDPDLIKAIITAESGWNPNAISNRGAMGLMQLMPNTAKELGVDDPFNPYKNIMAGTYYYKLMYEKFKNHRKALYAYNAGPEKVLNNKVPYESRQYAERVLRLYETMKGRRKRG